MRKYGVLEVGSPKTPFSYLSTRQYSSSIGSSRGVRLQGHIINTLSEERDKLLALKITSPWEKKPNKCEHPKTYW
jgi:hypothetical protein